MRELADGIWHWQGPHPDWTEQADWQRLVSSYAVDDGERLLVFDPIAPPALLDELAAGREAAILLTTPWHLRDARALVARIGASLHAPPPDEGDPEPVPGEVFQVGETLPLGVRVFQGIEPNDVVLWVERRGALVFGDSLIDRGSGLELPRDWATKGIAPDEVLASHRRLLELPVEHVLPTHGQPAGRDALVRALA